MSSALPCSTCTERGLQIISYLLAPLQYEFFQHALVSALIVGCLCGFVGAYVVLRKMSYVGHGLSHAVLGGGVLGYVLGINFYIMAGLWGFLAALAIDAIARKRRVGADAAIGVVTMAAFAFGVVLISRGRSFARNFEAALFGNVLGVTNTDIIIIGLAAALVLVLCTVLYRQLLFLTFDPEVAPVYGVRQGIVDALFSLMLAGTIIVSAQIMGVTLIAAALVTPAVVARFLTSSFRVMLGLSTFFGGVSGLLGVFLSYYLDAASGATIVLTAAGMFVIAYAAFLLRERAEIRRGMSRSRPALPAFPDE